MTPLSRIHIILPSIPIHSTLKPNSSSVTASSSPFQVINMSQQNLTHRPKHWASLNRAKTHTRLLSCSTPLHRTCMARLSSIPSVPSCFETHLEPLEHRARDWSCSDCKCSSRSHFLPNCSHLHLFERNPTYPTPHPTLHVTENHSSHPLLVPYSKER